MLVNFKRLSLHKGSQRGITLIEVMISMVILGVGLLAIVGLQSKGMSFNSGSKRQTQSYTWAMDFSERLMSENYATSDKLDFGIGKTLDPVADVDLINDMDPYVVTWDVADNDANLAGSKLVNVHITYNGREVARIDFTRIQDSI